MRLYERSDGAIMNYEFNDLMFSVDEMFNACTLNTG